MQAMDVPTVDAREDVPIEDPIEIPRAREDRPRWGFTLACAAVSLGLVGLGVLKGREAWHGANAASGPHPGSGAAFVPADMDPYFVEHYMTPVEQVPGARARRPVVKAGQVTVNGRLPPEVIGRIVRQNQGRFRLCYENGLRNNRALAGHVGVRFVIGRDGSVSNVSNGGSDLPDSAVIACIVRSFYGLSFPRPDSGVVTVTYPVNLRPR